MTETHHVSPVWSFDRSLDALVTSYTLVNLWIETTLRASNTNT